MKNKFNIYKIPIRNKPELLEKFQTVGLEKTGDLEINGWKLLFYLSKTPDRIEVWWSDFYKDLIGTNNLENSVYYGCLLAIKEDEFFAVSLGKTHFYLQKYADRSFGLDLAERIADRNDLRIKNSKYYQSTKSKTITSYNNATLLYDSGESIHYLKSGTIDKKVWGATASFGTSVQLSLEIDLRNIPQLLDKIVTKLKENAINNFPKVEKVKSETVIRTLDEKLQDEISRISEDSNVSTDDFGLVGVFFVFPDESKFQIYSGYKKSKELDTLTLKDIAGFVTRHNMNINNVRVKVIRETSRPYSKDLKYFLEYVDNDNYCLLDGYWHQFNKSYLDYLEEEANKIKFIQKKVDDFDGGITEELFLNEKEQKGYLNAHKSTEIIRRKYNVEKMDLYKDNALFFVKLGTFQKAGYVIDQALNTLNLIRQEGFRVEIEGDKKKIDKICLWILSRNKKRHQKTSDIRSLIFTMKLVEFRKQCKELDIEPELRINYERES